MSGGLPVPVTPYGPLGALARQVHEFTVNGHHRRALTCAEQGAMVAALFDDTRTLRVVMLGRMYALVSLGRLDEALAIGEWLIQTPTGPRSTDAKVLADVSEIQLRLGRTDDGLHHLARALVLLQSVPRDAHYLSALSSVCDAAKAAELFELADEGMRAAAEWFATSDDRLYRSSTELQRAELLLEWGLRLHQVGRAEEAAGTFRKSVALLEGCTSADADSPLHGALLAVGCAEIGMRDRAQQFVDSLLLPMRAAGQHHEARLLHLAHGILLRHAGELTAARREFLAAEQLSVHPHQNLIFRHEAAVTALLESPGEAGRTLFRAVVSQAEALWQVRMDRRLMLRQAVRRVELEVARTSADLEAVSDPLTGLGNRRMFDRRIGDLPADGVLLLIDVDRFKDINDEYSHGVGDRVLVEIASVLRSHCRRDEVAVRFGGDEFALFLHASVAEATVIAERIRRVIAAWDWATLADGLQVTLSMGLAPSSPGMTGHELYDRADRSLYTAKRSGRDRLAVTR